MSQNRRADHSGGGAIGSEPNADLLSAIAASRTPILLIEPDQPGNPIVHVNGAFSDLTGYAAEEVLGREVAMLHGPTADTAACALLRAAIDGRRPATLELETCCKDGSRFASTLFLSPVHHPDGRLHYFLCSLLTVAKQAVAPRRAEPPGLTELRELARSVGHEFNNLLTIIRSNLEPLRLDAEDARTVKRLDRIALAVDRGAELVRTFAAKARGDAPRETTDPSPQSKLPRAREGETVLLVEPDDMLGLQAASMLRSLGYQVEAAVDGKAALQWLRGATRIDLMLARQEDGTVLMEQAHVIMSGLPVLFSAEPSSPPPAGTVARPFQLVALARAVRAAIDSGAATRHATARGRKGGR